ncbi:unnamed protein product [Soboliphyme baturini]|uniref:Chitin-binding type-2 domain-containing protein n=1 Tax=Soboliphyme baturini TaxID=241478 RepID=A0A183IBT0_9BILA|nr:unnamed protein product [Soboliphyme baturini]
MSDGYYVHEYDSTKYYLCKGGTESKLECDDKLVFNPVTTLCEEQPKSNLSLIDYDGFCKHHFKDGVYRHPHDRTVAVVCLKGTAFLIDCRLVNNSQLDFGHDDDNHNDDDDDDEDDDDDDDDDRDHDDDDNICSGHFDEDDIDDIFPWLGTAKTFDCSALEDGKYPLGGINCSAFFFECVGGFPFATRCPLDYVFNPATSSCAEVSSVTGCASRAAVQWDDDFCRGKSNDFYASPNDCSTYFMCIEERTVQLHCKQGTIYDAETKSCRSFADAVQPCGKRKRGSGGKCRATIKRRAWPDAKCNMFKECTDRTSMQYYCEDGFFFDNRTHTCELAKPHGECNFDRYRLHLLVIIDIYGSSVCLSSDDVIGLCQRVGNTPKRTG